MTDIIGVVTPPLQRPELTKAIRSSEDKSGVSLVLPTSYLATPYSLFFRRRMIEPGFAPTDSTVTVFACEAPNDIFYSGTARGLLRVCADRLSATGLAQMGVMAGDIFIAFGPEHANMLAADGWRKADIQSFLFEHARRPLRDLYRQDPISARLPKWMDAANPEERRPVVRKAGDIYMFVAGGPGGMHSAALPGWGARKAIRKITAPGQ